MTIPQLFTTSWSALNRAHETDALDVQPVRISPGLSRFWKGAAEFPYIPELGPVGLLGIEDRDEFAERYIHRLDSFGPELIGTRLERAFTSARNKPLALCCFESERSDCHRRLTAWWIEQVLGFKCPEFVALRNEAA